MKYDSRFQADEIMILGWKTSASLKINPPLHYFAMLRYVPWDNWLGKSRSHEYFMRQYHWLHKETSMHN